MKSEDVFSFISYSIVYCDSAITRHEGAMNTERLLKMKSSFEAAKGICWEDASEEIQQEWTTCWDLAIASVTIELPQNPLEFKRDRHAQLSASYQ
ncbi:hypothetical protein EGJ50_10445 [Pseudomonas luteola]|nr:hypothetical protein EGJ50_10445 [Pseudomonas luteola]